MRLTKDEWQNILDEFKSDEDEYMDNIIFLIDDKRLCKALITWKHITAKFSDKDTNPINDKWMNIWEHCVYDLKKFTGTMAIQEKESLEIINQLRELHLIYPDGTVNNVANSVVKGIIKQQITKVTGKKQTQRKE